VDQAWLSTDDNNLKAGHSHTRSVGEHESHVVVDVFEIVTRKGWVKSRLVLEAIQIQNGRSHRVNTSNNKTRG
jgi:hypothetical protein